MITYAFLCICIQPSECAYLWRFFTKILRIKNIHLSIKFVLLFCFVIMEKAIANAFNNRVCRICFSLIHQNTDHIYQRYNHVTKRKKYHILERVKRHKIQTCWFPVSSLFSIDCKVRIELHCKVGRGVHLELKFNSI